ncbi:serine/threonine-protein kinase dst4-like [Diadema setosum]|uniref:serine/threonine-protein kinase dst4-like n=1 Tax=Diadema setosum TaxID=31175 RepID=UPI003B3B2F62
MMALSYKDKETLLVMQLVEGSNLKDLLFSDNHRHKMSLSKAEKVQISLGILQAIRYLHESKILHLDIKPSNIIVEKLGKKAYLCDLGFAHMESLNSPKASSLSVRGTRYYMPPECLKASRRGRDPGESVMTSASDIWSLGCTLLELLTEKPLWGIAPHSYLLTDHLNGFYNQPPVLRRADSDIKRIMRPCLREEPNERPSAAELMNRFQELPMRICLSGNE